jgi:hypothetical protein
MFASSKRKWMMLSVMGLGLLAATPMRAADDETGLRYKAWAKFKPGSSATLAADISFNANQNNVTAHMEMTRTLKSVTDDQVEIEVVTKMDVMGHSQTSPPRIENIKADESSKDVKELDKQSVDAMGKTFSCKVYELSGDQASSVAPTGPGAHPNPGSGKATIYANEDVPGGIVKIDATGREGKQVTFLLTAMDAK